MTYSVSFFVTLAFLICPNTLAGNLPTYVSLCSRNSPELSRCFKESLQSIRPHLANGISEFQIPPAKNLLVPFIHLGHKNSPSINLNASLKNVKFDGLEKYDVVDAKIDLDDPLLSLKLHFQELMLNCNNVVKGKVLSITIDGEGVLATKNRDLSVTCEWKGEKYIQDGREHLKFKISNQSSVVDYFEINTEGLFKQNPEIETTFNQMLKENADLLRSDLQSYMADIVCGTFTSFQNRVFSLFDLDQLFPLN